MSLSRVVVLGGGLMGSGISEVSAAAGLAVVVRDVDGDALETARGRVR
jgi:3-hydroxybutyryl-CoA dehydrogenase